jgi:hypothetical protein
MLPYGPLRGGKERTTPANEHTRLLTAAATHATPEDDFAPSSLRHTTGTVCEHGSVLEQLGCVQHGGRSVRKQRRDALEQHLDGARAGEVEEDAILVLFDVGRYFEEREDQGGRLSVSQRRVLQGVRAQGMVEDIGGTGQEQTAGVGQEGRCRGAVTMEVAFHSLDRIFTGATGAVEVFV